MQLIGEHVSSLVEGYVANRLDHTPSERRLSHAVPHASRRPEIQAFQEGLIILHLLLQVELRVASETLFYIHIQNRPYVDSVFALLRHLLLLHHEAYLLHELVCRASLLVLGARSGALRQFRYSLLIEILYLFVPDLPLLLPRFLYELSVRLEVRVGGIVNLFHDLGDVRPQQGLIVDQLRLRCDVLLLHQLYRFVYFFFLHI